MMRAELQVSDCQVKEANSNGWRSVVFLLLGCLLLGLVKIWLIAGDQVSTYPPGSMEWGFARSANFLLQGRWLGPIFRMVPADPAGYSLWLYLVAKSGLSLRFAGELLFLASSLVFAYSLFRAGLSVFFSLIVFFGFAFNPFTLELYQGLSPSTLVLPVLILGISLVLLAGIETKRSRSYWIWCLAGLCAGALLITVSRTLPRWAIPVFLFFSAFLALGKEGAWYSNERLRRWAIPALLLLSVAFGVELSLRLANHFHYGRFAVGGRLFLPAWEGGQRLRSQPDEALFQKWSRPSPSILPWKSKSYRVKGWAVDFKSPLRSISVVNAGGIPLGEQRHFFWRLDIQKYFEEHQKPTPPNSGFQVDTDWTSSELDRLSVVFRNAAGKTVKIPLKKGMNLGENFRYDFDLIETKMLPELWRGRLRNFCETLNRAALGFGALGGLFFLWFGGAWRRGLETRRYLFLVLGSFVLGSCLQYLLLGRSGLALAEQQRAWPAFALWPAMFLLLVEGAIRAGRLKEACGDFRGAIGRRTSPQNWFLLLALGFGPIILVLNPPMQAPDEGLHFWRCYQISEGKSRGAPVPQSLGETVDRFWRISQHPEAKLSYSDIQEALRIPLAPENRAYLGATTTFPIPYFPQAFGFFLARQAGLSSLAMMYLGRLMNLLVWTLMVYAAIRRTPIFKWVFLFLALSPMCLYLASSLSHDVFLNGLAFLFLAEILALAFNDGERLSKKKVLLLVLLATLVALAKTVYFLLPLLFLIIPLRKASGKLVYAFQAFLVFTSGIVANWLWNHYASVFPKLAAGSPASQPSQLSILLEDPLRFFAILSGTAEVHGTFLWHSFVGKLGWLDTELPGWVYSFYILAVLIAALLDHIPKIRLRCFDKVVLGAIVAGETLGIFSALYLTWTSLGYPYIEGVQGRYFIPLSPLFFLLLYQRKWPAVARGSLLLVWVPWASVLCLSATVVAMLARYWL